MITILLILVCLILLIFCLSLSAQIRKINKLLEKRLYTQSQEQLKLQLISPALNDLAANINQCLSTEENLRLQSFRENRQFREMIAGISHDLRTPLTAIKGYHQLLEESGLNADQLQKLQIAETHTTGLKHLIEHFFEYMHLLDDEQTTVFETFCLPALITECLAGSVPEFEKKEITVRYSEAIPFSIKSDKEKIIRITQNLIRNVLEHASGYVEIIVHADTQAHIIFRNPAAHSETIDIERIFDRFYTADSSRSKTTGLGLAIVMHLAKQLGGTAAAHIHNAIFEIEIILPLTLE